MGIRYEWDSDERIIANIFIESPWSWTEYNALIKDLMPILRDLKHPCATIVDVTKYGSLPRDGNIIQILLGVDRAMPDNMFASAMVGAPYGVTIFMNMLTKLSPHAKRMALFTSSIEEARTKILERYQEMQSASTHD
jgi:hypothetical protein